MELLEQQLAEGKQVQDHMWQFLNFSDVDKITFVKFCAVA